MNMLLLVHAYCCLVYVATSSGSMVLKSAWPGESMLHNDPMSSM